MNKVVRSLINPASRRAALSFGSLKVIAALTDACLVLAASVSGFFIYRGTCKTASAAGIFKISGDFRMSATRRRSVSDMLILLGTTSGKLGIADDVATG
jgi:hypothetical protein